MGFHYSACLVAYSAFLAYGVSRPAAFIGGVMLLVALAVLLALESVPG